MLNKVLDFFPPHAHPLTLLSDPDRLMNGEELMRELTQRGFIIIQEEDPVLLRLQLAESLPLSEVNPVVVITTGALKDLPYDLWQRAYRISFSLNQFFPKLSYPILQTLSPDQIDELAECPSPETTLSRNRSIEYVLAHVFGVDIEGLKTASRFIAWLNEYHHHASLLPDILRSYLVSRLRVVPHFTEWNIDRLIRDAAAFSRFLQEQWEYAVSCYTSEKRVSDLPMDYQVHFDQDHKLQELIPSLVWNGSLLPIEVEKQFVLPAWMIPGVTRIDPQLARLETLLELTDSRMTGIMESQEVVRWLEWEEFARDWAELSSYFGESSLVISLSQKEKYHRLLGELDNLFIDWLINNYSSMGSQRLPKPHHVYHIPHYIAYLRALKQIDNFVLLVMDGMSLTDWQVVKNTWTHRHSDWNVMTSQVLAQVPTITSISRFALVSGLRPVEFLKESSGNMSEARAWELFWSREEVPAENCKLLTLSYDRKIDQMPELQDPRVKFWCLVDDTIDKFSHNASLGSTEQQASLRLWLNPKQDQNSLPLEGLIDRFLDRGYTVFITSDHGHTEATGIGQPSEGLLAQTRGKRARLYKDAMSATWIQSAFPNTVLWERDGILPDGMTALMPKGREAFAPYGEVVISHGGISLEETIVPLAKIMKASR